MSIIICKPNVIAYRQVRTCPNCKVRRRIVVLLMGWYGSEAMCCACGCTIHPDESVYRVPKPKDADSQIAYAKEKWKSATLKWREAFQLDYEISVGE